MLIASQDSSARLWKPARRFTTIGPNLSLLASLLRPFTPSLKTVRHYSLHKFRRDIVAGLTVSVVEVPQAMAYAIIAGVPPQYGLYTSIIQGVIGAMLSSSEHMTTGPTNTQSLLIASAVKRIVAPDADPALYLHLVFSLAFLKGLIQLTFAAARMGDLVRYVSRSVIVGLAAGAGVLIFVGQLPAFLGVEHASRVSPLWGILGRLDVLRDVFHTVNPRAVAVGAGVIAAIVGVRMINKLLPGALASVIGSAALVWAAGWTSNDLPMIGELPRGLPKFTIPLAGWQYSRELLGGALALAILGMLESVAIAKSIAAHTGERISANQEFFAQGLKNATTSFFQCIPGSGSFTRSALDHAAGAETRFAAVFNAVFVAVIFLLLAPQAQHVPTASLAGVLFVIAAGLIDWHYMARVWRTHRSDAAVCFTTLAATLLAPLEYAIFVGIFLNIGLYLRKASRLHMAEMIPPGAGGGAFIERPITDRAGNKRVIFLQIEGDLFFAVADELQDRLNALVNSGVRIIILRMKRTHSVDATVVHTLESFNTEMKRRGGHVLLCGVRPELMTTLRRSGLIEQLGVNNVFEAGFGIFASAKAALRRARELAESSIDTDHLEPDLTDEDLDEDPLDSAML